MVNTVQACRAPSRVAMLKAAAAACLLLAGACMAAQAQPATPLGSAGLFFDDFSQPDTTALQAAGWILRRAPGHPGVPGALWAPEGLQLLPDDEQPGNRLLRLQAHTNGTPAGTQQVQLCHARKLLHGTYAARLRLANAPTQGQQGDPVIQAFYAVAPLQHAYDPKFSEVDWEYLANGGWGSPQPRLYGISWQTVRIEPWDAHNSAQELPGRLTGWHTLTMQVQPDAVLMYLDHRLVARHTGRNVPVQPMALAFSLWFSPTGLLPPSPSPRVWTLDVDWAFHAQHQLLSPEQVMAEVQRLRERGVGRVDAVVGVGVAGVDSPCDM